MMLKKLPLYNFNNSTLLVYQQCYSRWKKINSHCCAGFTLFEQKRRMGNQNIPSVIKSPFKHLENVPNVSYTELLWEKIEKFPDHTAVECGITGRKYTFSQVKKLSQKFAVSLLRYGLRPGQTVAIVSENCPEYPIVAYGCLEAGLVVTMVNYVYTADEICYQLVDSGSVCVVANPARLDAVTDAVAKAKSSNKHNSEIKILVIDTELEDPMEVPSGVGRFSELIGDSVDPSDLPKFRNGDIDSAAVAILPYSSGTTGLSKGVQISHKNLVTNLLQFSAVTQIRETTKDHQDVLPGILPIYHAYGFTTNLTKALFHGSKVVTLPKFEPKSFLDVLKTQKCSVVILVPPLLLFLGSPGVTSDHLQHIRAIMCAAAPISDTDVDKCLEKIPKENNIVFQQAYGLTECTTVLSCSPTYSNISSVGAPVSNTMMKVVDVESRELLGPHQEGEVLAKGPQIMMGYHNNPKATASTIDSEGWIHTGDVGYYDENGLFYIVDRMKELIKVKGSQVPPAELEGLLRSMPGIKDAGVVGVPDKRAGELPIAYVVPSTTNRASVSDIKTYISEKVAPYKQLSDVVFVDAIPKSPSGKILRRVIREQYLKARTKEPSSTS